MLASLLCLLCICISFCFELFPRIGRFYSSAKMIHSSYGSSHKDEDEDLYEDFQYRFVFLSVFCIFLLLKENVSNLSFFFPSCSNDAINNPPMTGFQGSMGQDPSGSFNSRPQSIRFPSFFSFCNCLILPLCS